MGFIFLASTLVEDNIYVSFSFVAVSIFYLAFYTCQNGISPPSRWTAPSETRYPIATLNIMVINYADCFSLTEKANSAPAKSVTYSGLLPHDRWVKGDTLCVTEVCPHWLLFALVWQRWWCLQWQIVRAGGGEEAWADEVPDSAAQHRRPGSSVRLWTTGLWSQ